MLMKNNLTSKLIRALALLAASAPLVNLHAADVTWDNGAANGLWTDGVNWNPSNTLPGTADTAIIGGTGNIDATGAATIDALRITRAVTISNGTIAMDATANQSGGSGIFQTDPAGASNNVTIGSNLSFTGSTTSGTIAMIRVNGQGNTTINGTVTNTNNLGAAGSQFLDVSGGVGVGQTANLIFNGAITTTRTTGNTELMINRGTVEFNAANTWTNAGTLRMNSAVSSGTGTLKLGHATALGTSSFAIGGTDAGLGVNTYTQQLLQTGTNTVANNIAIRNTAATTILGADIASGNATYSGGVTLNNVTTGGTAGAINLKSVQAGGTVNFSGLLTNGNTGQLVVRDLTIGNATTGLGTVNFTRAAGNTYTGNTTVSGGSFLVNNTSGSATGSGTVTVSSGASLGGSGGISGATTIQSGGFLAPGNSPGSLVLGDNLVVAGTVQIELGGTAFTLNGTEEYDRIKLTGATASLNLTGSTLSVIQWNGFVPSAGDAFGIFQLEAGASISSTLGGFAEGATVTTIGGQEIKITYVANFGDSGAVSLTGGNDIALYAPIPEPSAYAALAGLGVLGLAAARRRRAA